MSKANSARGHKKPARDDDSVTPALTQAPSDDPAGTTDYATRLAELEQIVEEGLETFVAVGEALREIRDSRLYREQHKTFEAYCRERWGWDRRNANRYVEAAEIARRLGSIDPNSCDLALGVANVGQARAIAPLYSEDEAKAAELMRELHSEHGENLTAAKISQAVSLELQAQSAAGDENPTPGDTGGEEESPTHPEPALALYRHGDLPLPPEMLSEVLGSGRPAALSYDISASGGKQAPLRHAKTFLEVAARAAWGVNCDAHLLVLCAPDCRARETAERALRRTSTKRRPRRDSIATAFPLLTPSRRSTAMGKRNSSATFDFTVARDKEGRLVLQRGYARLSIPVAREIVAGLEEPARVFAGLEDHYKSAAASGETVVFDHEKAGEPLVLKGGPRRFELPAYHVEEFTANPFSAGAEEEAVYEAGALRSAIDRVRRYTAQEKDDREVLWCVLFDEREGGTRLAATDTYRLAWDDSLTAAPLSESVKVLAGDLAILSRMLGAADSEARVSFFRGGSLGESLVVSGELVDGTTYEMVSQPPPADFPKYWQLLPNEKDLARFGLPAGATLKAVETAATLTKETINPVVPVRVEFLPEESAATISIKTAGGSFSETVEARVPRDVAIRAACFSPFFLAQALRSHPGEEMVWVGINQSDGSSNSTLKPVMFGKDVLLMTMRCPSETGE